MTYNTDTNDQEALSAAQPPGIAAADNSPAEPRTSEKASERSSLSITNSQLSTDAPPPHMSLASVPVARVVGLVGTLSVLLIFWLLWRGRELPFTEMRYQLSDSTGYQPLPRQRYLFGSVPRTVGGRAFGPVRSPLPDSPDGSAPAAADRLTSPYPTDKPLLDLGKKVYTTNCGMCHGDGGRGDGPVGESYIPRPPDLTGPDIASLRDGRIYYSITNGILSQPIPEAAKYIPRDWHAFRLETTERERWAVVSFVRSFEIKMVAQRMENTHAVP